MSKSKSKLSKSGKKKSSPKQKIGNKPNNPKNLSAPMKAGLAAVAGMAVRKDSKLDMVVTMLRQPEGVTLDDIMTATGWQKHTVRSAISHGLVKKRGYNIVSDKPKGGQRIYKIAGAGK